MRLMGFKVGDIVQCIKPDNTGAKLNAIYRVIVVHNNQLDHGGTINVDGLYEPLLTKGIYAYRFTLHKESKIQQLLKEVDNIDGNKI